MRSGPLPNLTGILTEGHISSIVQSIFDGPLPTDQFQQAKGSRAFRCQAGEAVDILLRTLERVLDPPTDTKDLSNFVPIACQKVVEFGGNLDQAATLPSMSFVGHAIGAPIDAIERRLLKKQAQIVMEGGLIALDKEQVVAT